MKRLFGLCTGLALMLSTVGCCYYPGQFNPSTGLTSGGYWGVGCLAPLNPFCWFGGCGYGYGGYGAPTIGYGAPTIGYGAPAIGYGAPTIGGPTYVQPGFAPSYGGGGCSECTSSPTYSTRRIVVPPGVSPTPAVPTPATGTPGTSNGSTSWVVPTPVSATETAPLQTAGQPMWVPARY